MLNTIRVKVKWMIVKLVNGKCWSGKDGIGCVQFSESQILIFDGGSLACNDNVFLFDFTKNTIEFQASKLPKKDWFFTATPIRLKDGTICIAGGSKGDIHTLPKDEMTWSILDIEVWNK